MLEVYTWEPNANSGKPLFGLLEKRVPFVLHYVDMAEWLAGVGERPAVRAALGEGGIYREMATMGPERGGWG